MIAKLVVHGRDRTEALRMLRKGLDEFKVVGVATNVEFLRSLAGNEAFVAGEVETGFISVSYFVLLCVNWMDPFFVETLRSAVPCASRAL
jgi:acetyl/propionyl-CoA carboxylase alpha subunit